MLDERTDTNEVLTASKTRGKKLGDRIKKQIVGYRAKCYGYKKISKLTGLSENTVKAFCRRNGLGGVRRVTRSNAVRTTCLNCGANLKQTRGHRPRKFCCDSCRTIWWNSHLDAVERKTFYDFQCKYCGKMFTAYGDAHRKYCSFECYLKDRFGENVHSREGNRANPTI